jgi:hypothetical protein
MQIPNIIEAKIVSWPLQIKLAGLKNDNERLKANIKKEAWNNQASLGTYFFLGRKYLVSVNITCSNILSA